MMKPLLPVTGRCAPASRVAARIGLFGLLGSGNIGNDGSFEAILAFLQARHPDAILECRCPGPQEMTARYSIPATRMNWYRAEYQTASSLPAMAAKAFGKVVDAFRTLWWVRRFDVVIVPGSGILESALPLRPWARPYALFLVGVSCRVFRTKVALVSIGANATAEPLSRWLLVSAARSAHYRSFRDELSRKAMTGKRTRAVRDPVYPDLAFALPTPADAVAGDGSVGVGVMAYYGGNDDRKRADEIYAAYVGKIIQFVSWLVDNGRPVRLLTGDHVDDNVASEVVSDVCAHRPDLDPSRVVAAPVSSLTELMEQIARVDTVVATRYHNVLCALKMRKPTVSVGYASKNDVLMSEMGLGEFCQSARGLDVNLLIEQFTAVELRREEIRRCLESRNEAAERLLDRQFHVLSAEIVAATRQRGRHRPRYRSATSARVSV